MNSSAKTEEWAASLADSVKRELQRKAAEDARTLSDRKLIERGAKLMWSELRGEVEARVAALNGSFGKPLLRVKLDREKRRLALVDAALDRELEVFVYQPIGHSLYVGDCSYRLRVEGVNDLVWFCEEWRSSSIKSSLAALAIERAVRDLRSR